MPTSTPDGSVTTLADVMEVLDAASAQGVTVWLDGGWGVDALLGSQTRPHGDLDLALETHHLAAFESALQDLGYVRRDEPSALAWNFLLAKPSGAVVDLHLIDLDPAGNGVLGPPEHGAVYPATSLAGQGVIGSRIVRCVAAHHAVQFHDAYEGDADDRADVRALCARFGLPIPEQYQ